jgi:uncharacterized membrane protein YfcA
MMNPLLVVALVSLCIGLSKGGLGGPMLIPLLTPLLSQIMPAPQAVGTALPLLIAGDVFALRMYWRKWDIDQIKRLLPMSIAGVIAGTVVLAILTIRPDDTMLRRIIGLFGLLVAVYKLINERLKTIQYQSHRWHGYLAGVTSGFGSALANVGAPPFAAYMLMQEVSPESFIGTSTLYFAIVNVVKLPGVLGLGLVDLQAIQHLAWALLLIPLGVWLGRWLVLRVNPKAFEWSVLVLLVWVSVILVVAPS